MKPQTVYLSNQDCFEKEHIQDIDGDFYLKSEGYFFTPEQLKAIIAEAFEAGWTARGFNPKTFEDDKRKYIQTVLDK